MHQVPKFASINGPLYVRLVTPGPIEQNDKSEKCVNTRINSGNVTQKGPHERALINVPLATCASNHPHALAMYLQTDVVAPLAAGVKCPFELFRRLSLTLQSGTSYDQVIRIGSAARRVNTHLQLWVLNGRFAQDRIESDGPSQARMRGRSPSKPRLSMANSQIGRNVVVRVVLAGRHITATRPR
jgi:hypothetical protein